MAKILVENTKPRVITVPDHALRPGQEHPDSLLPGVNEVDLDAWEKALEIKVVKHMVDSGELKPAKLVEPKSLDEAGALELVEKTVDRELLERWAKAEKRGKVRGAIAKQLEAITPKASKDGQE